MKSSLYNCLRKKSLLFFMIWLFIGISSITVQGQVPLTLPAIEGGPTQTLPCENCVPPGWTIVNVNPDLVFGNGPHPDHNFTISGIEGPSPLGGAMELFGSVTTPFFEAMQTIVTGLSPNTTYSFTVYFNPIVVSSNTQSGNIGIGGNLTITVNGSQTVYTPSSNAWNTVNRTFTTGSGQTTSTIILGIQSASGSGQFPGLPDTYGYIAVDAGAPPCSAGTAQVSLNSGTLSNTCPSNTVNLNSLFTGAAPTNSSLVWFNNANHTGTAYATPATAGGGTYFAFFYDAANNCYNTDASTSSVTVSINGCSTCPTTAPTFSVPTDILCWNSTKDLNVFISSSTPGGSVVVWKDAGGATVTNPVNAPGVYTATYFNAALNCSSPAATFTLTVIPDPVPSSTTINICSPATTADVTNVVTAPVGSGYTVLWFNSNGSPNSNITALPPGTYNVWYRVGTLCYNRNQVNVTITNNPATCTTVAGTIDCNKTRLVPSPVAGTASQVDLVVTVNVTTAGCFTPIAVSGSGFSIASGITQLCATRLGVQEFHLPVNYNGAVLSSLNFTIGQAGSCVADLTKPPKKKEVTVWTLDNCTPPNIGPVLK